MKEEMETINKDEIEEQRQNMIAQGRDHLANVEAMAARRAVEEEALFENLQRLQREKLAVDELRVTWLERLAMMLRVDVSRVMDGAAVKLVWADTDGDPVTDDETGEFINVINDFDDISKMVISRPKVVEEEQ